MIIVLLGILLANLWRQSLEVFLLYIVNINNNLVCVCACVCVCVCVFIPYYVCFVEWK